MLKKNFTKELRKQLFNNILDRLSNQFIGHIDGTGETVTFSFKSDEYEHLSLLIQITYYDGHISRPHYEITNYELEKYISLICNVSYSKIIKHPQPTYRYQRFMDDAYLKKDLSPNYQKWEDLDRDKMISDQDYVDAVTECLIVDLEEVGFPFLKRIKENPYCFMIFEKKDYSKTVGGDSGLKTNPWEGWWIRKIIAAYKNNQVEDAFQYLEDLKTEVIEYPEQDEDVIIYATEVYERAKQVITGTPIENIGKMKAPLPEYRQYMAKEETEEDFLVSISDDEVDQFGAIDIFGMYFINAYREDFALQYLAKNLNNNNLRYEDFGDIAEQTIQDIVEETNDKYINYLCNKEKNYTLVTFTEWTDRAINETFDNGINSQQKILADIFPNADIIGISFQETTGCAGFVHLKSREKIRGFYYIDGEVKTDFGTMPEDEHTEKDEYFAKQSQAMERLFPHAINSMMLEQTVSILKKN